MKLRGSVFSAWILLCEVFAVALFLRGFFPAPVKSSTPSKSRRSELPPEPVTGRAGNSSAPPPGPLFRRLVLMLVDGFREDFLLGPDGRSHMPYTRHLVERGPTHSYVAKARAPTVTMPRIKALVSGSVPSFVDVVLNLDSTALLQDNLLLQARDAGLRIFFYGDDTWIKLFPKHFAQSEGTTSFFVSDYTEVDNNVTRHLDGVLRRDDWDVLVLHYLGLDHIGHTSGPHSALVPPKLLEMDDVFKKIHGALVSKQTEGALPYLLVLCGDHGMSESGGHGGSSDPEVNTALLLLSPAFRRKEGMQRPLEVEQVDLAPSLALGLGLPVPRDSVGRILPQILEGLSLRDQLRLLHLNGHQLSRLLRDSLPAEYQRDPGWELFRVAERAHGSWVSLYLEGNRSEVLQSVGQKVLKQYLQALASMSAALSRQLGRYDLYSMTVGLGLALQLLVLLLLSAPQGLSGAALVEVPVLRSLASLPFLLLSAALGGAHVCVCTSGRGAGFLCEGPWGLGLCTAGLMGALCCVNGAVLGERLQRPGRSRLQPFSSSCSSSCSSLSELDLLLVGGTLGHALLLGSSSFVEEEHQIWYFLLNTLCLALFQDVCRRYFRERPPLDSQPLPESEAPLDPLDPLDPAEVLPWTRGHVGAQKWLALATPPFTLLCCRLLRALNQTGVQWAHLPDLGHWLNSSEHQGALSVVAALCLLLIFLLVQRRCSLVSKAALALGLIGVYSYRAAIGNVRFPWQRTERHADKGTVEARFVFVFVLGLLFSGAKDLLGAQLGGAPGLRRRGLWEAYAGLVLVVALLLRAHNLPVLCGSLLLQTLMAQLVWRPLQYDAARVATMHYWFGQAAFYCQGNSNNIGTVDVSVGFVGLDRYLEAPAVVLTVLSTYAGPVLWGAHLLCYLSYSRSPAALSRASFSLALLRSVPCVLFLLFISVLRNHLFIWSVFSPKLLYESVQLLLTSAVLLLYSASQTRPGPGPDRD